MLSQQGCQLRWIKDAAVADPVAIAQAGRSVSLILLADEGQCEAAAFAISDRAPVFGDGTFKNPLVDVELPANLDELLRFAPGIKPTEANTRLRHEVAA